ncbi:uncharacterized protein LOC117506328, partial [Thalassophryne amazonica]|uniref:uncharacterized protein LOC117506328 n=1 Tax=Thalassophryne amazonica TaxID=390379 RepID=UPI0014709645
MGLGLVLEFVDDLLQFLKSFSLSLVDQLKSAGELTLNQVKGQMVMVMNILPIHQVQDVSPQIQQLFQDLQELSKILLQLLINTTPLYTKFQQPTAQEVEDFLSQADFMMEKLPNRSSASSLFLKAMDGQPRRRCSLYSRVAHGSAPASPDTPSGRRTSIKQDVPETSQPLPSAGPVQRRLSATELLVTPLKQLVSQSQKAF